MSIEIIEEPVSALAAYGEVSIAFEVKSQLRIESINNGLGGVLFKEEEIEDPYIKDPDLIEGERPPSMGEDHGYNPLGCFISL